MAASVQAPAIYRLFGDKHGLLEAVAEHVMAVHVATKIDVVRDAAANGVDPLDDLRAGWETAIEFGLANPALFALMSNPGRGHDSPAAQTGHAVLASRVHRVALTGRLRVSEQRAVGMIQAAGTGTVLALLSVPPLERDPGLAEAMYDAVIQLILTDVPPARSAGAMATTVAFRALTPEIQALSPAERHLMGEWLDRAIAGGPGLPD